MRGAFVCLVVCVTLAMGVSAQTVVTSFATPGRDPRGLAWDGQYLWCADAGTDTVYKLDPNSGETISSFPFPIQYVHGGLAWGSDGNILIAYGTRIYIVNPIDGGIVDRITCESG